MKGFKYLLSTCLVVATILAATISTTSTAIAGPSGLACPGTVKVGHTIRCTFNTGGHNSFRITTSNPAATVIALNVNPDGTEGWVTVQGESPGGVTVCVEGEFGHYQTCDQIEVVP